ncbi:MAG: PASTA domain-containing protein [Candidatus Sulfotelmatobacter sp.]
MRSFFRFAMLALVLVTVALVSALTAMRFAIHGQEVVVPTLVGLSPTEAERAVSGPGLLVEIERQYYSPQIPEGRIMSQVPLPGTKVRRGWQVRVAQSLGPLRVVIPDVTGQSEHAAELNIRRRGLELVSTAEVQIEGLPPDQVLAQSPAANASQVAAPKISLLLTATPDPEVFTMPSFLGQPLGSASRTLQDAGFKLGNVSVAPPAPVPPASDGTSSSTANPSPVTPAPVNAAPAQPSPASGIVSQTPPPGQRIVAGGFVNFDVR